MNWKDGNNQGPLAAAVGAGEREVVKILLEAGASARELKGSGAIMQKQLLRRKCGKN